MKSLLFILLLSSGAAHAERATPQTITGTISFEKQARPGGEVYLRIRGEGAVAIPIEKGKKKDQKEAEQNEPVSVPESKMQFISLGSNSAKPINFSTSLKPGRYSVGCLIKIGEPECTQYRVNRGNSVTQCLPGKKDLTCGEVAIEVTTTSVRDVNLKVGLPVESNK